MPSENVDLKGLVLSGYSITKRDNPAEPAESYAPLLRPIGSGNMAKDPDPKRYLREILERLNHLFGEATPIQDRATFVNHVVKITREDDVVMAQLENNTREQAMKGNLRSAIEKGVVRVMRSHQVLATQVLRRTSRGWMHWLISFMT